jgi:hypothetical protein
MDESQTMRVSVAEAARLLGIEKDSVKKRIQRGKLRSEKDVRGATWVFLDGVDVSETVRDSSEAQPETVRDELIEEIRDRVRSLERRMDEEREARRRADTIIAQLTQANAALAARVPELPPAASQEPSQVPGTDVEEPERTEPRPSTEEPQEPAQEEQRSWWRRIFGS